MSKRTEEFERLAQGVADAYADVPGPAADALRLIFYHGEEIIEGIGMLDFVDENREIEKKIGDIIDEVNMYIQARLDFDERFSKAKDDPLD